MKRLRAEKSIFNWSRVFLVLVLLGCNNQLIRQSPSTDLFSAVPEGGTPSLDASLGFHPKRLWRLVLRWDPFMMDRKQAWVQKDFQLFIEDSRERQQFEKEINLIGGEEPYLAWLQTRLAPIGRSDRLLESRISRLRDSTIVSLIYRSENPVPIKGAFSVEHVEFPGMPTAVRSLGCASNDESFMSESIEKDLNIAFEIVLHSRRIALLNNTYSAQVAESSLPLYASLWEQMRFRTDRVQVAERSHVLKDRVVYRTGIRISPPFAKCPIRPEDISLLTKLRFWQPMGVEW
ncbi:MAG TPA: hypothetical protein PLH57_00390 [Oligoflexia bacterium]|nr:hypothetical protein [Oligoflexia bacterium]